MTCEIWWSWKQVKMFLIIQIEVFNGDPYISSLEKKGLL